MTHPQEKGNEGLIAVIQQWIELRKLHVACGPAEDLLERALTALKNAASRLKDNTEEGNE